MNGRRVLSEYHRAQVGGLPEERKQRTYDQSMVKRMAMCLEGPLDTGHSPSGKALCAPESTLPLTDLRQGLKWPAYTQHALRPWVHPKH